ncbi:hypothetical protein DLJ54_09040 [Corynebacterium heidelbergense]|uniref:Uncharacterized protein n=2 Tax=Corynebacterium heidelbergense TaxID=2055947 RepID=A0A364V3U2_9CORY|nr:hypothetical protein DLJ54_09040 [Corynebacterium heidelbergense]
MVSSHSFVSLGDTIPNLDSPSGAQQVRDFISHLCVMNTQSFYNAAMVLAQDPEATAALPQGGWRSLGFELLPGARRLAVMCRCGPAGIVYDVRHTRPRDGEGGAPCLADLQQSRFDLEPGKAVEKVERMLPRLGVVDEDHTLLSLGETTAAVSSQEGLAVRCFKPIYPPEDSKDAPIVYSFAVDPMSAVPMGRTPDECYLGDTLFSIALLMSVFRVPWLQYVRDDIGVSPQTWREETLRRSCEQLDPDKSAAAYSLEASLAVFILSARFGWSLKAPLARRFMADDSFPVPEYTEFRRTLVACHFLEKQLATPISLFTDLERF